MLRSLCFVIGLGLLGIRPALPDIVDVTVNGSVSGSGFLTIACALSTPGCIAGPGGDFLTVPYSFSGTNTELGAFSDSGSTVSTTGIDFPYPALAQGYADQDTTATADALDITLTGGHSASGAPFYGGSENDNISVSFDLTGESLVQLSGGIPSNSAPTTGELLDSDGKRGSCAS